MSGLSITERDVASFAVKLEEDEKSASTIANYIRDAGRFAVWVNGRPLTKQLVIEWKAAQSCCGLAPATVNCRIAAVNGLLAHIGREPLRIKPLHVQRRVFCDERQELTAEDYRRLVTAARTAGRERIALIIETICATGIRVSELRNITVECACRGETHIVLKGKVRSILLPGKLSAKLRKYAARTGVSSGEIFRTSSGRPVSRKQVWSEMKALCGLAQVSPEKVFPHNLRHLFARSFYKESRDVVKLADVLGHSSLETTRIYLVSTCAEHRAVLEKMRLTI